MNVLEMRAGDYHYPVTHPKARKVNDSYKNSHVYMSLCTSYCYRSLAFSTSFFYLRM